MHRVYFAITGYGNIFVILPTLAVCCIGNGRVAMSESSFKIKLLLWWRVSCVKPLLAPLLDSKCISYTAGENRFCNSCGRFLNS